MATIEFGDPSITFSDAGLAGETAMFPTALEFARSGEPVLFVTQQDGTIHRYVLERVGDGFEVSAVATPSQTGPAAIEIDVVKAGVANYDDGGPGPAGARQITGLAVREEVVGGVARDVLYVTSSDNRIGGGDGADDEGVDGNSSQIHRVVVDRHSGEVLQSVALVRGLPRSAENHAANGLDLGTDPETGDLLLYVAQGANTNKGAPSNNFVGLAETAWTGAVLKLNLTELSAYDVRIDGQGEAFVLDLPTLNDPARADLDLAALGIEGLALDPNFALDDNGTGANGALLPDWAGGARGHNSAKITEHVLVSEGGQLKLAPNPLTVVQPGHRNPYDVLVAEGGEVLTWDNGPNTGWGGEPLSFQDGAVVDDWRTDLGTHDFNESQADSYWDQLHVVGLVGEEAGPYAGFPNVIRAAGEALALAFAADGSYLGATPGSPILDADGAVVFTGEAAARDFLARLLPIHEKVDGVWVDTRPVDAAGDPVLPSDLHDVVSGYDWAHPGSGIADPKAHFDGPSIMDGHAFSPEAQEMPWGQDGSLILGSGSTNGLAQYTAGGWFDGALDGAVLATGWGGGKLLFTELQDTDGDGRTDAAAAMGSISGFGSKPLDVTALGDEGLGRFVDNDGDGVDDFSGVIAAVTYGTHAVTTFTPGGTPSGLDVDRDDDGLEDVLDTHVGDPLDGRSVLAGGAPLRWDFVLSDPSSTPPGAAQPHAPAGGIGITAAWTNGTDPAVDGGLYDDANWDLGGASTFVSSEEADDGTADGAENSLRNVLGLGATLSKWLGSATITTEMLNVFDYGPNRDTGRTWTGGEEVGLVLGPDQSDFVRATIAREADGRTGLRLASETADVPGEVVFVEMPGVEAPASPDNQNSLIQLTLALDMTPGAETVAARARYQNPEPAAAWSPWFETEAIALPGPVREALHGEHAHQGRETGPVIGLYAGTAPGDDGFAASWDWVEIDGTPVEVTGEGSPVYRWNAGLETVKAIDGGPDWIATTAPIAEGSADRAVSRTVAGRDASVPDTVPQEVFAETRWDDEAAPEWRLTFGADLLGEPLAQGPYAVRILVGDGFADSTESGLRKFDIDVEGERLVSELDPTGAWGHATGGMVEWRGLVLDGAVDVTFGHELRDPLVAGIEIVALDGAVTSASGAEIDAAAATVAIAGNDGPAVAGEVLHRVNAGGERLEVTGPDWRADQAAASAGGTAETGEPSPHLAGGGDRTLGHGPFAGPNPTGAPAELFETARLGEDGPLSYAFDVADGEHQLTLHFAERWEGAKAPGGRVFDVAVEGRTVLQDLDPAARYGWGAAGSETFAVSVVDGTLDLDLVPEVGDPAIAAIELRSLGPVAREDKGPDHRGDFSDARDAPTRVTLDPGGNTLRATQVGEPDYVTVVVPEGHALTRIELKNHDAPEPVLMGLSEGKKFRAELADDAPKLEKLLGGVVYDAGSEGTDLMAMLADGVVEGRGDARTRGFTDPLGPGEYTLGWGPDDDMAKTVLKLKVEPTQKAPKGAAELRITPDGGIQTSNYGAGSFELTNTGDKDIASFRLNARNALYPDSVFDPYGLAGDSTSKPLTIDQGGGTGVREPDAGSYFGEGGAQGYKRIGIEFDAGRSGGFDPGETLGFSIDMDPNSVAGSRKDVLDRGADPLWDVGGVSGAELIGSIFRVTFTDGTSAWGQIISDGSQSGAQGRAKEGPGKAAPALKADGHGPGEVGAYGDGGPAVTIQGEAGQTARVVLTKGFIQPAQNEFSGAYAERLDAQLKALAGSDFPANNAVEFQTVDVRLNGQVQDITGRFEFGGIEGVGLDSEDDLPLGLVAAVVDDTGMPESAVTEPIYLAHDEGDGGRREIVVHAGGEALRRADDTLEKPGFVVEADGEVVGGAKVAEAGAKTFDGDYDAFVFSFDGPRPDEVEITFRNDDHRRPGGPGDEVVLYIDRIEVDGFVFEAEVDGLVDGRGGGARERMALGDTTMTFADLDYG